jgi:hypothetical protein
MGDIVQVTVSFAPGTDASKVSTYSIGVLKDVMLKAGVDSVTISSVARNASEQAVAMYNNIQKTSLDTQKDLYGSAGDKVLDVYDADVKAGKLKDAIIQDMKAKIEELGVSKVTRHAADLSKLNVFDVGPNSVSPQANKAKFAKAANDDPRVSRFFEPPDDPGYHFEVPQPTPGS